MFKANNNSIIDSSDGKQIAVVLPVNCSKKAAREMAAYCAQQMNHAAVNDMPPNAGVERPLAEEEK